MLYPAELSGLVVCNCHESGGLAMMKFRQSFPSKLECSGDGDLAPGNGPYLIERC